MTKKILQKLYPAILLFYGFLPLLAEAQGVTVEGTITKLSRTASQVIGLLFVFATIVFLWGMLVYIAKSDDEGARKKAKGTMTWGIVGMAVMASAWGIVSMFTRYFGFGTGSVPTGSQLLPSGLTR